MKRTVYGLSAGLIGLLTAWLGVGLYGALFEADADAPSPEQNGPETHNHEHREDGALHRESSGSHEEHSPSHEEPAEEAHAAHGHESHAKSEARVTLSSEERSSLSLKTEPAVKRPLTFDLTLPANVRLNEDQVAHVVPRLSGIVLEVQKSVGETVKAGELLAVLDCRELADAKAEHLAAHARLALAQKSYQREKALWEQGIAAEKDYLEALRDLEETQIALRATQQKLHALGISESRIKDVRSQSGASLTRYEIRAPFDGQIVEKHIVLGEALDTQSVAFVIADMTSVWIDVNVFQKDLLRVQEGMSVTLSGPAALPPANGVISYLSPIVEEKSRTVLARIILPNEDGQWRPGLFLDVTISFAGAPLSWTLPKTALQQIEGQTVVFLEEQEDFLAVPVTVGREGAEFIEILDGVEEGRRYVSAGAFELKAKWVTSGMDAHAGHAH